MTDIATINASLSGLVKGMLAKGFHKPDAHCTVQANDRLYIYVAWVPAGREVRTYSGDTELFYGDTFEEAIGNARNWLDDQPTVEQRQFREFTEMLAKTIEVGKQNGIDAVLVNPLEAAMKTLSKNALTVSKADAIERSDARAEHA